MAVIDTKLYCSTPIRSTLLSCILFGGASNRRNYYEGSRIQSAILIYGEERKEAEEEERDIE
jgi:hypothetical protein